MFFLSCVCVGGVVLCRCVCVCDLLIFLHIAPERPGGINRKERASAALETAVLHL